MPLDWSPFVAFVRSRRRFLLTTHVRPDPDGLGSMLGLAETLDALGKDVRMLIASVWPPRYRFMDPGERIRRLELPGHEFDDAEGIVVLDTGTWNQLGDFGELMKRSTAPKCVIDHHVSQDDLGATRFVDVSAEATGRLVFEAIEALGQTPSKSVANHLFSALATDTGWFRHPNTTPATYGLAEKLVRAGAEPTRLYEQLYERSNLSRLRLLGLALERLETSHDGRVAFTEVRRDDYAATGAIPSDTEELVNHPRSVEGVQVAMVFMEQPAGGVKISFRSREPISVAAVAETFGGGGHRLAAGAIVNASLEETKRRVLAAVAAALAK